MFNIEKIDNMIKTFSEVDEKATNNQTIVLGNMSEEGLFIVGHKDDFLMVYTDYDKSGEPKPFFTIASRYGNLYTYRETDDMFLRMREREEIIKNSILNYFPQLDVAKNRYDFEGLTKATQHFKNTYIYSDGFCNDWHISKDDSRDALSLIVYYKDTPIAFIENNRVSFLTHDFNNEEKELITKHLSENLFSVYRNPLINDGYNTDNYFKNEKESNLDSFDRIEKVLDMDGDVRYILCRTDSMIGMDIDLGDGWFVEYDIDRRLETSRISSTRELLDFCKEHDLHGLEIFDNSVGKECDELLHQKYGYSEEWVLIGGEKDRVLSPDLTDEGWLPDFLEGKEIVEKEDDMER